jgi:hypothetical protein
LRQSCLAQNNIKICDVVLLHGVFAYFRGFCRKLLIIFTNLYGFIMTFRENYVIMSLSVRKKGNKTEKRYTKDVRIFWFNEIP